MSEEFERTDIGQSEDQVGWCYRGMEARHDEGTSGSGQAQQQQQQQLVFMQLFMCVCVWWGGCCHSQQGWGQPGVSARVSKRGLSTVYSMLEFVILSLLL